MARKTYLSQVLNERQVNMIAFSSCIGFGLFLHSGKVINLAGPGLAIIAFSLAASVVWCVVSCLGEMTALFPVQGPLFEFPGRFIDAAVGYSIGWMVWFGWCVTISAQTLAICQLWKFNFPEEYLREVGYPDETLSWGTKGYSPAVWVTVTLVLVLFTNLLPVKQYGQLEYLFGTAKMVFISGLIVFNVAISAQKKYHEGGVFWTWNKPYGFATQNLTIHPTGVSGGGSLVEGDAGRFLSLWTSMTYCFFAYTGFETIAVTAAENKDLEKYETIKMGSRKLTLRVSILYILGAFVGGLNVPYNDLMLMDIRTRQRLGGQNSIFIIAAVRNRLRGWPNFFNGFFIFSATTSAINAVYCASRLLHALASIPEAWPIFLQDFRKRLEQTSLRGVPLGAIITSWTFGLLGFLSIKPGPALIHSRVVEFVTCCCLLDYAAICLAYIYFNKRIEDVAQNSNLENRSAYNRDDEQYPYRSSGQRVRAYYGFIFCVLLILFHDWRIFVPPFNTAEFLASYIAPLALVILVIAYHIGAQGWNPLNWHRDASMQITRPPPTVVVPSRRVGRLEFPNPKMPWWEKHNLQAITEFVWVWVK